MYADHIAPTTVDALRTGTLVVGNMDIREGCKAYIRRTRTLAAISCNSK
jgi:hypothetical protein